MNLPGGNNNGFTKGEKLHRKCLQTGLQTGNRPTLTKTHTYTRTARHWRHQVEKREGGPKYQNLLTVRSICFPEMGKHLSINHLDRGGLGTDHLAVTFSPTVSEGFSQARMSGDYGLPKKLEPGGNWPGEVNMIPLRAYALDGAQYWLTSSLLGFWSL